MVRSLAFNQSIDAKVPFVFEFLCLRQEKLSSAVATTETSLAAHVQASSAASCACDVRCALSASIHALLYQLLVQPLF
jgi:hypothetical protein